MTTSRTFPPHEISDELIVKPTAFIDANTGVETTFPSLELGDGAVHQAYDLGTVDWSELQVSFEVSHDRASLTGLIQPGESVDTAIQVILSVRCPTTKVRFVEPLSVHGDVWCGTVVLDRRTVQGVVVVRPLLYRAIPGISDPRPGRANEYGALIGEGPAVELRVDTYASPFEGGLDVRWEDFRSSEDKWRRAHDGDLYGMTFDPEPTVWLNLRHEEVHALLHDVTVTGAAAAIRSAVFSVLKEGIWSSLLHAAIYSVERDPETDELVIPDGWQSTVLEKVLPHMYPELSSMEAQTSELYTSLEARSGASEVEVRLRTAVQALSSSGSLLARLVSITEGAR